MVAILRWTLAAVATALWLALSAAGAQAEDAGKRVALVIGNSRYAAAPLANPRRDADTVGQSLVAAGFDTVVVHDLDSRAFNSALQAFRRRAQGAEIALLYYAGHGIEGKGANWLIPIDARLQSEDDLQFEAVPMSLAQSVMQGARLRVLILDACRNDPFKRNWATYANSLVRATPRGGLRLPEGEDGSLILYAADAGATANDGPPTGNSPFAASLARYLREPEVEVAKLGSYVRQDVLRATNRTQNPVYAVNMPPDPVYLVASAGGGARPTPAPSPSPAARGARARIAAGEPFRVLFTVPGDTCRSGDTYNTKLGNAVGTNGVYDLSFTRLPNGKFRWLAAGPHQTDCAPLEKPWDTDDDPAAGRFAIWGASFAFDDDGRVWDWSDMGEPFDVGAGTPPGSRERTIGRILFND